MKHHQFFVALAILGSTSIMGNAQTMNAHSMHHSSNKDSVAAQSSTGQYQEDMEKMHQDMMMDYSGDADIDFAKGMIPHHQGAIDMAKTELRYGKDPEMRKFAQGVIDAQEKEIIFLHKWLQKNPIVKK